MPTYRVVKLIDSYSRYVADVEAEDEKSALALAEDDWRRGRGIEWSFDGTSEYDDAVFEIDDSGPAIREGDRDSESSQIAQRS